SGELQFHSGTLDIRGAGMTVGAGGIIGNSVQLTPDKALFVTNTTTLSPGSSLSLDGGLFVTGALAGAGSVTLNSGTLRLTNSDMTIGAGGIFGSTFQVNTGARVDITGAGKKAIVNSGAQLYLGGGSLSAVGGITNNGEIQLAAGASRLSGGSLVNNGLLRGSGRIDNLLSNSSTGT